MLSQLSKGVRARFPVLLTHKYACDQSVVDLLRSRTLGNSPTALRNTLHELHSEEWLRGQLDFLTACQRHKKGLASYLPPVTYLQPSPPPPFSPPGDFLQHMYITETCGREWTTSWQQLLQHYGSVLKIDSTKKICKKLQESEGGTASWMTNVGNEVLLSVLTTSESVESLKSLADGLTIRQQHHRTLTPTTTGGSCYEHQGYDIVEHEVSLPTMWSGWALAVQRPIQLCAFSGRCEDH